MILKQNNKRVKTTVLLNTMGESYIRIRNNVNENLYESVVAGIENKLSSCVNIKELLTLMSRFEIK